MQYGVRPTCGTQPARYWRKNVLLRLSDSQRLFYFHGPTFGKLNSAYNVAVVKKRRLEVLVGRARVPKFRRMAGHGSRDRNVGDVNRQMTVDRNFSE